MDTRIAQVNELFTDWDRPDAPGCVLAIISEAETIYQRAYGLADLERNVPLSTDSIFDIASISKQFVAMSAVMLAQAGKLDLEDDIRRYLPEMAAYEAPITIRHLIHHTSGLRDYLELMDLAGMRFANDYFEAEIIDLIARQQGLNFAPGDDYLYSNSGYFLLGEIVIRVSGQSLNDFSRAHIFEPLGMTQTRFYDDFSAIIPNRAIGYQPQAEGGFKTELYLFDLVGDGGVLTNVGDLFRWDQNFYQNKLAGGPELIEQMLVTRPLNNGRPNDYAFGLIVGDYQGLPIVRHSGGWAGYRSEMIRFPSRRFSVICLANRADFRPTPLTKKVADIFLADHFQVTRVEPAADAQPAAVDLAANVGVYRDSAGTHIWKITLVDDHLTALRLDGLTFDLTPLNPTQFRAVDAPFEATFTFDPGLAAAPARLTIQIKDRDPFIGERGQTISPDTKTLAAYIGSYDSSELKIVWRINLRQGQLVRKLGYNPDEARLEPIIADEFSLPGQLLRFGRDQAGQINGFDLFAGRIKDIHFERRT